MEYFKNIFLKQIRRLKNVREGSELYFIFFRFSQVSALLATLYCLIVIPILSTDLSLFSLNTFSSRVYFVVALGGALTSLLCEIGLRCLDKNKLLGLYIGVLLSLKYLFSLGFLLGLFGLYALLNPAAQQKFLFAAPPWLKDLLTFCRINYIMEAKRPKGG